MGRRPLPTENRLILSIAKHGGTATRTQIRDAFYGRLTSVVFELACRNLGDLIVSEKTRAKGSKRPTTSVSLTLKGWAAVQFLRPGWQPRRLAADILKAWLAELQSERDPWALSIARDHEDAALWRRAEAERKAKDRAAEARRAAREKPEPRYPSAGRNRSEEELEARREWAASKGFAAKGDPAPEESLNEPTYKIPGRSDMAPSNWRPELSIPPSPIYTVATTLTQESRLSRGAGRVPQGAPMGAPKEICTICENGRYDWRKGECPKHDCTQYSQPVDVPLLRGGLHGGAPVIRTREGVREDPAVIERVKAKAVRLNMADAIRPNGMLYDNKVISFEKWDEYVEG